jgi:hypothetical protein
MCFSLRGEAAGMVASMAILLKPAAARSKVRRPSAAEHRRNFACRFCPFAKTQQNYEEPPLERKRRGRFYLRHYSKPTMWLLSQEKAGRRKQQGS